MLAVTIASGLCARHQVAGRKHLELCVACPAFLRPYHVLHFTAAPAACCVMCQTHLMSILSSTGQSINCLISQPFNFTMYVLGLSSGVTRQQLEHQHALSMSFSNASDSSAAKRMQPDDALKESTTATSHALALSVKLHLLPSGLIRGVSRQYLGKVTYT